jgi:TRAP-type C4-dicarboxylate transport system permease small subunit
MRLKKALNTFETIIFTMNQIGRNIAFVIIFSLMFLTFFDVIGRYLSIPITGTFELTELGLASIVFLSLGYAQFHKEHIAIGVIVDRWSPKVQSIMGIFIYLTTFIVVIFLSKQLFVYGERLQMSNTVSGDLSLPIYIFVYLSSFGALVYALTLLLDFFKSVLKVVDGHES